MVTENVLKNLYAALERVEAVDRDKLLRPGLGEASLQARFGPILKQIGDLAGFVSKYAPGLHDQDVEWARAAFTEIANQLEAQANREPGEYTQQTQNFLRAVRAHLYDALRWKQLASDVCGTTAIMVLFSLAF